MQKQVELERVWRKSIKKVGPWEWLYKRKVGINWKVHLKVMVIQRKEDEVDSGGKLIERESFSRLSR